MVKEANTPRKQNAGTEIQSDAVSVSRKISSCTVDGCIRSHCHDPQENGTETNIETNDLTKFDHVFSGWSIWLEPERTKPLQQEMSYLERSCGGKECGVMPFVPHLTLLYNIRPFKLDDDFVPLINDTTTPKDTTTPSSITINASNELATESTSSLNPEQLLGQCWHELIQWRVKNDKSFFKGPLSAGDANGKGSEDPDKPFSLTRSSPMGLCAAIPPQLAETKIQVFDWYYQHYRKSDDGGKGFGCCIAHLLVQPTPWLDKLQHICCEVFGPDERTKFIPHISLVYGPESYGDFVRRHVLSRQQQQQQDEPREITPGELGDVQEGKISPIDPYHPVAVDSLSTTRTDEASSSANVSTCWWQEPQTVAYLSLWSTIGRVEDWYCIAKVPIS